MFDVSDKLSVFQDPAVAELIALMPGLKLQFAQLEFVPRRGWYIRNAPQECDFDGEHTRRLIWAIRQLPDELGLNKDLMVKLAFVHDMPEKMGFDITLHDNAFAQKKILEPRWCDEVAALLGPNGYIFRDLWTTYDTKEIDEAKHTGDYDKLDCLVHAMEKRTKGYSIDDFIENSETQLANPFPQWLHFKLSNTATDKAPFVIYEALLGSYDEFKKDHDAYAKSNVYHTSSFTDYLKTGEVTREIGAFDLRTLSRNKSDGPVATGLNP